MHFLQHFRFRGNAVLFYFSDRKTVREKTNSIVKHDYLISSMLCFLKISRIPNDLELTKSQAIVYI